MRRGPASRRTRLLARRVQGGAMEPTSAAAMERWRAAMPAALLAAGLTPALAGDKALWHALDDATGRAALLYVQGGGVGALPPRFAAGGKLAAGAFGTVYAVAADAGEGQRLVRKDQLQEGGGERDARRFAREMLTEAVIQVALQTHEATAAFVPRLVRVGAARAVVPPRPPSVAAGSGASPTGSGSRASSVDYAPSSNGRGAAPRSGRSLSLDAADDVSAPAPWVFSAVMERCDGTLTTWLADAAAAEPDGAAPWAALAPPLVALTEALQALQATFRFSHRDFREPNVMYVARGDDGAVAWLFIDFGMACMTVEPVVGQPLVLRGGNCADDAAPCLDPARDMAVMLATLTRSSLTPLSAEARANLRTLMGDVYDAVDAGRARPQLHPPFHDSAALPALRVKAGVGARLSTEPAVLLAALHSPGLSSPLESARASPTAGTFFRLRAAAPQQGTAAPEKRGRAANETDAAPAETGSKRLRGGSATRRARRALRASRRGPQRTR
jgi:hypothetical protein